MNETVDSLTRRVSRRHVFYLSGFDPLGPSRYHGIYAAEALKQSRVNGVPLEVSRRHNEGKTVSWWQVQALIAGEAIQTRYEFLRWDDIVRTQWPRSRWAQALQTLSTTWHYLRTGALRRQWAVYPVGASICAMPSAVLVGLLVWTAGSAVLVWRLAAAWGAAMTVLPWMLGMAAAMGVAHWLERRLQLAWLMRSYTFTVQFALGKVPEMEARLAAFGRRIADVIDQSEVDEVLVVGHSSGTMMAVSAVARALDHVPQRRGDGPALSLMTLGHCIPVLSTLNEASGFRDDLHRVANARRWTWLDFTAPADGCSFVLTDPTKGCEDMPGASQDRPKLLSPRFATMFSSADYRLIVRDKMRYHFQYLMSTGKPGVYDYFDITAGALTLAQRFSDMHSLTDFHAKRRAGRNS